MIWMAVIMSLPLLGVALFFFYPWQSAVDPTISGSEKKRS